MEYIGALVIGIIVFIGLFLLLREVNCWYWKINERISLIQEQNQLLRKIASSGNTYIGVESNPIHGKMNTSSSGHIVTQPNPSINYDVEPDIERIKSDLIGQKIPGWMFSYLSEFKSSEILKVAKSTDTIEYHVKFNLIDSNSSNVHDCELTLIYIHNDKGWILNDLNTLYIT